MIIDSKQFEAEINFESIDEMEETDDERLSITYIVPTENQGSQRMMELFECFEIDEILKAYNKIKTQLATSTKSKSQMAKK